MATKYLLKAKHLYSDDIVYFNPEDIRPITRYESPGHGAPKISKPGFIIDGSMYINIYSSLESWSKDWNISKA